MTDLLANKTGATAAVETFQPDGLRELEMTASALDTPARSVALFRAAQQKLWLGLGAQRSRWLITDFVSVGSPMYFADRLYTRNARQFADWVSTSASSGHRQSTSIRRWLATVLGTRLSSG